MAKNWGLCLLGEGDLGLHLTQYLEVSL